MASEASVPGPFDQLLQEKIEELSDWESEQQALRDDPIVRLGLVARHVLRSSTRTPLPGVGGGAYRESRTTTGAEGRKLDVRF